LEKNRNHKSEELLPKEITSILLPNKNVKIPYHSNFFIGKKVYDTFINNFIDSYLQRNDIDLKDQFQDTVKIHKKRRRKKKKSIEDFENLYIDFNALYKNPKKKYNMSQLHFDVIKNKLIQSFETLFKYNIIDDKFANEIKRSKNFNELKKKNLLKNVFPKMLVFIDLLDKNKFKSKVKELKDKELAKLGKKNLDDVKDILKIEEYMNNYKAIKYLINENKTLQKKINKYHTPSKRIEDEIEAYIELIKKDPDKEPSIDSLADFSKGKSFERKRSSWADFIKTNRFINGIVPRIETEKEKLWEKMGKNEKKIKEIEKNINKEISQIEKNNLSKKIDKLKVLNDSLKKVTDAFEICRKKFSTIKREREKKIEKHESTFDSIINKESIRSMVGDELSEQEIKNLLREIKNYVYDYIRNR
jgi:hypothetical protein